MGRAPMASSSAARSPTPTATTRRWSPTSRSRGPERSARRCANSRRVARDPALRPYRIAVYVVYGLFCAVFFALLLRSIVGDLYGHRPSGVAPESPTACLEELRGRLSRTGEETAEDARRVKESLAQARKALGVH